jgi:hypothetical protein
VRSSLRVACLAVASALSLLAPVGVARADGPTNTTPPSIVGDPTAGATFYADQGQWDGATDWSYQWQRCDGQGDNCADIADATSSEYVLGDAEVGDTLRVVVTATGPGGSVAATSAPSPVVVAPSQPAHTGLPTLSYDEANVNVLIVTDEGSWTGGALNYDYTWERCDADGESCSDISGAVDWYGYIVTADDVGHRLRVRVTATNAVGSASVESDPTPVITNLSPANTAPPTVSGDAFPGGRLWADPGTWTHQGETLPSYQWQSCDAQGQNCADVAGATAQGYDLGPGDVGSTLRVVVSFPGPDGPVPAASEPTTVTDAPVPTWPSAPALEGDPTEGSTIDVASLESATGAPYQWDMTWQRCDAQGQSCADIAGATDWEYTLGPDDVGSTVRFSITATGYGGSATTVSAPTDVIAAG